MVLLLLPAACRSLSSSLDSLHTLLTQPTLLVSPHCPFGIPGHSSKMTHSTSSTTTARQRKVVADDGDGSTLFLSPTLSTPTTPSSASLVSPSSLPPRPNSFLNSDEQFIDDISVHFLYQPHTILSFLLVVALLLYFAFHSSDSLVTNLKLSALVCTLFILLLGLFVFPSGPFIRPHPLLWRLAFGVGVVYQLALLVLLFQTKAHARHALTYLYPYLGVPLHEKTYADQCDLTPANFFNAIDIFFVGHLLGWTVKALMLRDWRICWVISVQWELIEVVFRHMLPNFKECWWDSWLLDVALSNGLGIYIGCKLCEVLEMRQYRWTKVQDIPTLMGKLQRGVMQFTPSSWIKVQWEPTSTISRFMVVNIVIAAMNLAELDAFFLKYLLWIPPPCPLNIYRILVFCLIGPPGLRQVYLYMMNKDARSVGMFVWLACCVLFTEVCLIFKLAKQDPGTVGEFGGRTMEPHVMWGLVVGCVCYVVVVLWVCVRIVSSRRDVPVSSMSVKEKAEILQESDEQKDNGVGGSRPKVS